MRPLARGLFSLVSAASLLLLVLSCAMWVGSYYPSTQATVRAGDWTFRSHEGQVEVVQHLPASPEIVFPPGMSADMAASTIAGLPTRASRLNIERWYLGHVCRAHSYSWDWTNNTTTLTNSLYIRYSLLTFVGAVGTGVTGWRMIRARRARVRVDRGLCSACGYDLRASSGRCPECGVVA